MNLRLHGDTIAPPGMLEFAVNVWPHRRPALLQAALTKALADSDRYPDEAAAREAIAVRHRRNADEVLLTNGACEAFWLLAQAYRPRLAVVVHPSFTEPEVALRIHRTEVRQVFRESEHWHLDSADVPDKADYVVLGNPDNPTGALEPRKTSTALARPARLLVVDESFIDFVPSVDASLAGDSDVPGLIVVRSLTKLWSLAGIRAGYLLAAADTVDRLTAHRQPGSVNALACAALAICAADNDTPRCVAADVAAARAKLAEGLRTLPGVRVWPSAANFLLLRVPDGPRVIEALRERHNIAVRPAASFPGLDENHIRIAVRTHDDNGLLVRAFSEVLR